MNSDTFSKRDVSDYLFAPDRIAAFRPVHKYVVDAFDLDARFANTQNLFNGLSDGRRFFLFFGDVIEFFGRQQFLNQVARHYLAVANTSKKIIDLLTSVFGSDLL